MRGLGGADGNDELVVRDVHPGRRRTGLHREGLDFDETFRHDDVHGLQIAEIKSKDEWEDGYLCRDKVPAESRDDFTHRFYQGAHRDSSDSSSYERFRQGANTAKLLPYMAGAV
jgi:hypothetical protein